MGYLADSYKKQKRIKNLSLIILSICFVIFINSIDGSEFYLKFEGILVILLSAFFIISGLYIILRGTIFYKYADDSQHWPFTESTILDSDILHHQHDKYLPLIFYTYIVDNKKYKSKKFSFSENTYNLNEVKKIINEHRKNQIKKIYYNPNNPKISVMKLTFPDFPFFYFVFGVIFVLVGIILWYYLG